MKRQYGRHFDQLRPTKITYSFLDHLPGSVLFEMGKTRVLCAVSIQNSVPPYVRGKNHGWLTAEYALMPCSTSIRTARESTTMKRSGRSVEISRLISRALRSIIDLTALGERTIMVDCDVIQADGGTRTSALTGSYLALCKAQEVWLANNSIVKPFLKHQLAAVSVGILGEQAILDPDFEEDSTSIADFNFIFSDAETIIEIQGGAEKNPISWDLFLQASDLAKQGASALFSLYDNKVTPSVLDKTPLKKQEKVPFFSLMNRHIVSPSLEE